MFPCIPQYCSKSNMNIHCIVLLFNWNMWNMWYIFWNQKLAEIFVTDVYISVNCFVVSEVMDFLHIHLSFNIELYSYIPFSMDILLWKYFLFFINIKFGVIYIRGVKACGPYLVCNVVRCGPKSHPGNSKGPCNGASPSPGQLGLIYNPVAAIWAGKWSALDPRSQPGASKGPPPSHPLGMWTGGSEHAWGLVSLETIFSHKLTASRAPRMPAMLAASYADTQFLLAQLKVSFLPSNSKTAMESESAGCRNQLRPWPGCAAHLRTSTLLFEGRNLQLSKGTLRGQAPRIYLQPARAHRTRGEMRDPVVLQSPPPLEQER